MDARRSADPAFPSGYEVVIQGGRTPVGRDAVAWAREAESLGAGEICLNSIDADGTKAGYDLELTRKVSEAVGIPVIASGGAGTPRHLVDVLNEGRADAALVASMVHYGTYTVGAIKAELAKAGLPVRLEFR
jgi:cyclase